MHNDQKINYLELPATNMEATKAFFSQAFAWVFTDYGPDYCAFANAGIDGGFYRATVSASTSNGSVLVVFYSADLRRTQQRIEAAGGRIIKPVFSFPGGWRFHFADPSGNEFAVWSDVEISA